MTAKTLLLGLACALASPWALAADCIPRVSKGWIRTPPVAMPMLAGFARIENPCAAPVVVVGVTSEAFADVSLHRTEVVEGVSRMRAVPALVVPANGSVDLAPGGLHLMLMGAQSQPKAGASVPIALRLRDGRVIKARFDRRPANTVPSRGD